MNEGRTHPDNEKRDFVGEQGNTCPICGSASKTLGWRAHGGYAKFASMSTSQKQQALLERSRAHSQRNGDIKDRKEKLHLDVGLDPNKKFKQ